MLSRKQERAILELVNPNNRTLEDVAKKIGITERTLYNWLKIPNFQDRLRKEREKLVQEGSDNLRATFNLAVLTMRSLLFDKDSSIRLRASQAIVDHNLKLLEQKREKRLENPYSEYDDGNPDAPSQVMNIYQRLNRLKILTKSHLEKMNEEEDKKEREKSGGDEIKLKDP